MNPLRALFLSLSRMPPALMLVVIIGLAIVVTILVTGQVNQQQQEFQAKQAALQQQLSQKATVVYATKVIPEGATISSDAVEEKEVPAQQKPVDALGSSGEAISRIAKSTIDQGAIISSHDLQPIGISTGFESKIKDGFRAVTFGVDGNSGVAGFIAPGSHVDIICSAGSGSDLKAEPILSDVEVIAVGTVFQKTANAAAMPATSITVGISPTDADKLIKAVKVGSLYLTLRNGKDHTPVAVVDVSSFFNKPVAHNEVAALPPPPAQLPPPPGGFGGGAGLAPLPPPPPKDHEVEQWAGAQKEIRTVPKT